MKWFTILFLGLLAVVINPLTAQQATQEPPLDPLVTPIQGQLAFASNEGLIVLNTFDGTRSSVKGGGGSPVWDPTGTYLATVNYDTFAANLTDVRSTNVKTLIPDRISRNSSTAEYRTTAGWSANGQQIMYLVRTFVDLSLATGSSSYHLEIVDINTGAVNIIYEIAPHTVMNTLFPVPEDSENVILDSVNAARWNPVYTDWVLIEPLGIGKRTSTGEDIGIHEAGMYNYVTGQYISFKTLFPQRVISFTEWSADGRKIALNVMGGISVIEFTVQDGNPKLELLAASINSRDQAVLQWAGAGDILLTGISPGVSSSGNRSYHTTFLAQIIDGRWYSQEFVALTSKDLTYAGGNIDIALTASTDERNQLSCMFFDQVYPSRLQMSQRGQVAFTDGTPSRLRSEPGIDKTVVTQIQEGTEFEIIGGSYCVDDYRWWQIQLEDGTIGWAAEGQRRAYWLEPADRD